MRALVQNTITCPRCSAPLTTPVFSNKSGSSCTYCGLKITGRLFPRFFKPSEEKPTNHDISSENESSCFFHPDKLAVSHCAECGRFLCALCELNIQDRIICPTCLDNLDKEKKVKTFTNRVTYWDSIVMSLAILPMLIWPFTFITAPLTLILIWKHFKDNRHHIIPRNRWRFYFAGLVAGTQIMGWAIFIAALVKRI